MQIKFNFARLTDWDRIVLSFQEPLTMSFSTQWQLLLQVLVHRLAVSQ